MHQPWLLCVHLPFAVESVITLTVSQRRFATKVQPFLQAAAAASPPQSWGAASPSWGVASAQSPSPTNNSPSWSANPPFPVQGDSHISPVSKSVMKLRKSSHPGATDVIEPAMTFAQAGGVQTAFQSRGLPTAAASLVKERELCPAMTCWHMWGTLLPSVIWSYEGRGLHQQLVVSSTFLSGGTTHPSYKGSGLRMLSQEGLASFKRTEA